MEQTRLGIDNSNTISINNVEPTVSLELPEEELITKQSFKTNVQHFVQTHKKLIKIILFIIFNILAITYFTFASIHEFDKHKKCTEIETFECQTRWCRGYGTLFIFYIIFYIATVYYLVVKPFVWPILKKALKKLMVKYGKWIKM